jgi:hypothetical protein
MLFRSTPSTSPAAEERFPPPNVKLVRDGDYLLLQNYEGNVYRFPDPVQPRSVDIDG